MAQPKRRWSKARTGLRRSTWKLEKPTFVGSIKQKMHLFAQLLALSINCSSNTIPKSSFSSLFRREKGDSNEKNFN